MKKLKLLLTSLIVLVTATSCNVVIDNTTNPYYMNLENMVTAYDLWYVNIHKTSGTGDVPFLDIAFTLSFKNGKLYANNNLLGIGANGKEYGTLIGYYDTYSGLLKIDHNVDGRFTFDVIQLSNNEIELRDNYNNVSYYLEGYQKYNFDYNKLFYDNIEYFLQEYAAWEKSYTSIEGILNPFDNENYLSFTPENTTTFYSSKDQLGTTFANIFWDYVGTYSVADVQGKNDLKILTLYYDSGDNETFELNVINDNTIKLYQVNTGTTYEFTGINPIYYLKNSSKNSSKKSSSEQTGRKRTKVIRSMKILR